MFSRLNNFNYLIKATLPFSLIPQKKFPSPPPRQKNRCTNRYAQKKENNNRKKLKKILILLSLRFLSRQIFFNPLGSLSITKVPTEPSQSPSRMNGFLYRGISQGNSFPFTSSTGINTPSTLAQPFLSVISKVSMRHIG